MLIAPQLRRRSLGRELLSRIGVCSFRNVATNLDIDDALLQKALELGGLPSKKATVTAALREFIAHRQRLESLQYLGTIDFIDDFDRIIKEGRRAR